MCVNIYSLVVHISLVCCWGKVCVVLWTHWGNLKLNLKNLDTVVLSHSTPCSPGKSVQMSPEDSDQSDTCTSLSLLSEIDRLTFLLLAGSLGHHSHPLQGKKHKHHVICFGLIDLYLCSDGSHIRWLVLCPEHFHVFLPWSAQMGGAPVQCPDNVQFLCSDPYKVNPSWQEKLCDVPTLNHWFLGQKSPLSNWSWPGHNTSVYRGEDRRVC